MVNRRAEGLALAVALAVAGASGCHDRGPDLDRARASLAALLPLGAHCAIETECAAGFCVDGVCCNTACGGGVRDLLTCSNLYGPVPGLVDGTCTTLQPGDPCGSLTSVNPCTWRGSTINGGGNCPNPIGTTGLACFPCSDSSQCGGAYPVCLDGACVACNGDHGSGASAACSSAAPVCSNGQCGGCSGCSGTTPVCNLATNACSACNGNYGSGATLPCSASDAPACLTSGACAQCSATDAAACSNPTPACDTATNTCAACNGDYGSGASAACPTAQDPVCSGGICGTCSIDADCGSRKCQPVLGNCGAGCTIDDDCGATEWCAGGVCTPKSPNGSPIPGVDPVNGSCTPASGAHVCLSGVCDPGDNRCGLPNGATCGPPTEDAECRSGICFATDDRCGLPVGEPCGAQSECRALICAPTGTCGNCRTDADCGAADSGVICDALDETCKPGCRGTGGNGCPEGRECSSTDERAGHCSECLSDADCGGATSGTVCDETRQCVPGCRGYGNGCAAGAICTSLDGRVGACLTVEGGGPGCSAAPPGHTSSSWASLVLVLAALGMLRRRRS